MSMLEPATGLSDVTDKFGMGWTLDARTSLSANRPAIVLDYVTGALTSNVSA